MGARRRRTDQRVVRVERTGSTSLGTGRCTGAMLSECARRDAPTCRRSCSATPSGKTGSAPTRIVVGTTAYIDRKPVTIAGVAPAALPGLDFNVPDMFMPIAQREYFYPESTLLRAWSDGHRRHVRPARATACRAAAAREALRSTMQAMAAERPEVKSDEWLEPLLARHNFMRPSERHRRPRRRLVDRRAHRPGPDRGGGEPRQPRDVARHRARARARRAHGARRAAVEDRSPAGHRVGAAGRRWARRQPGVRVGGVDGDRGARRLSAVPGFQHRVADRGGRRRARRSVARGRRIAAGLEGRAAALDRRDQGRRPERVAHARSRR